MGQCQYCRRNPSSSSADAPGQEPSYTMNHQTRETLAGRHSGSDSAVDSGHSCCDEASCGGEQGRSSHSSESSGKYSLRESVGSVAECEKASLSHGQARALSGEMQELSIFSENESSSEKGGSEAGGGDEDALRPLQDIPRSRKVSRGSTGSDRGSISSISSVTAVLRARLSRSSSLKVERNCDDGGGTPTLGSPPLTSGQQPRRAVSLRLPRSHRRGHDSDTNLPTIYVEDSPQSKHPQAPGRGRKSSLRRALSLLSVNSLARHYPPQPKTQKPVQKILRQPRRRHNTVRGMSGMAIDRANQAGLQRANTLYYPTAATLRHSYAVRRTYSDNHS